MRQPNNREVKKLIKNFKEQTIFLSSVHAIYENINFLRLEKITNNIQNKKRLFKIIQNKLKDNVFLYVLLEKITNQKTIISEADRGKTKKILDFWLQYQY